MSNVAQAEKPNRTVEPCAGSTSVRYGGIGPGSARVGVGCGDATVLVAGGVAVGIACGAQASAATSTTRSPITGYARARTAPTEPLRLVERPIRRTDRRLGSLRICTLAGGTGARLRLTEPEVAIATD